MGYDLASRLTSSPDLVDYQLPLTQGYDVQSDSSSSSSYDAAQMGVQAIPANYNHTMPSYNQQTSYYGPAEKIPIQYIDTVSLDGGSQKHRRSNQSKEEPTTMHLRRRAQNRASQRAFRERKEKHVKGLEAQLQDLHGRHRSLLDSYSRQSEEVQKLHGKIQNLVTELDAYRPVTEIPFNDNSPGGSSEFQAAEKFDVVPFSGMSYPTPEPYFDNNTATTGLLQRSFSKGR